MSPRVVTRPSVLLYAALLGACSIAHERSASVADLRGVVTLSIAAEVTRDAQITWRASIDPAPGHPFDTNLCPVLRDDVTLTANGAPIAFDYRGGSHAEVQPKSIDWTSECGAPETRIVPAAASTDELELVLSDATGTISTRVVGLFTPPTIALAGGQPSTVKVGDRVRLALTPSTDVVSFAVAVDATLTMRSGESENAALAPGAGATSGELLFTVPATQARQTVDVTIEQPPVVAAIASCVGASACSALLGTLGYTTPKVALTIE